MEKRIRSISPVFFIGLFVSIVFPLAAVLVLTGKVIGVSDGDTIKLLTAEKEQVKIRLYGIDCPEKKQAFGTKAKQFTSDLCFGKAVSVKVVSKDRYGRTIGEVILPDGRSLNQEIVKEGFAWWYRQYSKNDTLLERLEKEAKTAKKGLWADPNPVPPWEFRKQKRKEVKI